MTILAGIFALGAQAQQGTLAEIITAIADKEAQVDKLTGDLGSLKAQRDALESEGWKKGGGINIGLAQSSFKNWAAGGENNILVNSNFFVYGNYKSGKNSWDNVFNGQYGIQKIGKEGFTKANDTWTFNSRYGRAISDKLNWAIDLELNSQFTASFNDEGGFVAGLLNPLKVNLGTGLDWKPNDNFSLYFSPLTAQVIYVQDEGIANAGLYTEAGEHVDFGLGAMVKAAYTRDLMFNRAGEPILNYNTQLRLFTDYLDNPFTEIDVRWRNGLNAKIFKNLISASLSTDLIYEHDTKIALDQDTNEDGVVDATEALGRAFGPRTQFSQLFTIGLGYTF